MNKLLNKILLWVSTNLKTTYSHKDLTGFQNLSGLNRNLSTLNRNLSTLNKNLSILNRNLSSLN